MKFNYAPKPIEKLKADFSRRKKDDAFGDFETFLKWYDQQEKACHYCGLSEAESQEIVMTGLLESKRFPQNGESGRGQSRGKWLEVDRIKPRGKYSKENCVLACYFCNNDKSDVFDGDEYKKFQSNKTEYLKRLIKNQQ